MKVPAAANVKKTASISWSVDDVTSFDLQQASLVDSLSSSLDFGFNSHSSLALKAGALLADCRFGNLSYDLHMKFPRSEVIYY